MSGDQLDLDAMREQLGDFMTPMSEVQKIGDALVAEVRRLREMIAPPCPECRQGKHVNCDGSTWDAVFDEPAECPCAERGHA